MSNVIEQNTHTHTLRLSYILFEMLNMDNYFKKLVVFNECKSLLIQKIIFWKKLYMV